MTGPGVRAVVARGLAAFSLAMVIHAGAWAQATPAACPAGDAARLGRSARDLLTAAAAAAQSLDDACVARALALADFLQLQGMEACFAAERLDVEDEDDADADLLAFRAALEWRCGRPRTAHELALSSLRQDRETTLAWRVLGQVLAARLRDAPARAAFEQALARDPREAGSLMGLAQITSDRASRRKLLERYLEAGPDRGEEMESLRGARENLDFLTALGDRPLWVLEKAALPGELPLSPLAPRLGKIAGWLARVDLGNEKRVSTLLDTGASGLHLDHRLGERAGLDPVAPGTLVGGGGPGEHRVERGTLAQAVIGPFTFGSALGTVAPTDLHPQGTFRAILGLDVLGGAVVRFLPEERKIVFEEAEAPQAPADPLEVNPWPARRGDLPIYLVEGQLLAPATFRSADREQAALVLVDTGAADSLLDVATADALGPYRRGSPGTAGAYGGTTNLEGVVGLVGLEIGSVREDLRNVAVIDLSTRARLLGTQVGAFVGEDVWSRNGFELDLAAGTLRPIPR